MVSGQLAGWVASSRSQRSQKLRLSEKSEVETRSRVVSRKYGIVNELKQKSLTLQELVARLTEYWSDRGCVIQQPYDIEVGAGTMSPETFLRVLGPQPYRVAYVQPSRRPADGRYGENPNRLYKHLQWQVILKPSPADIQEIYLKSLEKIGIDLRHHDLKFEEDNWESPTLGAWGIGWQVMLDGLEITQFTYFQQCGGIDLEPVSVELTLGLERIASFLQDTDSVYDIIWRGIRGIRRRCSRMVTCGWRMSCRCRCTTSRPRMLTTCGSTCGCMKASAKKLRRYHELNGELMRARYSGSRCVR